MFKRWSPGLGTFKARSCTRFEEERLHEQLEERFCKTLYYGALPDDSDSPSDSPSLPLTSLAVDYFRSATPRGLNQVDMDMASSLAEDAWVSPCSIVTSMIYAKRLRQRNPNYLLKMSSSDLFFISVMVASKYMYDEGVNEEVFNEDWAEAAKLETEEVNHLEQDFLTAMDWQLFVSRSEFLQSVHDIQKRIAWSQGCSRGWLSYTDLDILCHRNVVRRIWDSVALDFITPLSVSSTAYVAGVLTMLGSTALVLQMTTSITALAMQTHVQQPTVSQPLLYQPISTADGPGTELDQPIITADGPGTDLYQPISTADRPGTELGQPIITADRPGPELDMPIVGEDLHVLSSQHNQSQLMEAESYDRERPFSLDLPQVLAQLWAVVAFKDKFVHLMCAFSEGLKYTMSNKKMLKKCKTYRSHQISADTEQIPMEFCGRVNGHSSTRATSSQCEDMLHGHPSNQFPITIFCLISYLSEYRSSNNIVLDGNHVKSPDNDVYRHRHSNRPPEASFLTQYPDTIRGFTTSVPFAA